MKLSPMQLAIISAINAAPKKHLYSIVSGRFVTIEDNESYDVMVNSILRRFGDPTDLENNIALYQAVNGLLEADVVRKESFVTDQGAKVCAFWLAQAYRTA